MKYQWIFSLLCPFEAPNTGPRSGPSVLLAFWTCPEGSTAVTEWVCHGLLLFLMKIRSSSNQWFPAACNGSQMVAQQ